MSARPGHPFYVASVGGGGCGHQHKTEKQAANCAANDLRRHPDQAPFADVVKVTRKGESVNREVVASVAREERHAIRR